MNQPITKKKARELLRLDGDAQLAAFFGITQSAVSQWPEDAPIPLLRQLQVEAHLARLERADPGAQPQSAEAA